MIDRNGGRRTPDYNKTSSDQMSKYFDKLDNRHPLPQQDYDGQFLNDYRLGLYPNQLPACPTYSMPNYAYDPHYAMMQMQYEQALVEQQQMLMLMQNKGKSGTPKGFVGMSQYDPYGRRR